RPKADDCREFRAGTYLEFPCLRHLRFSNPPLRPLHGPTNQHRVSNRPSLGVVRRRRLQLLHLVCTGGSLLLPLPEVTPPIQTLIRLKASTAVVKTAAPSSARMPASRGMSDVKASKMPALKRSVAYVKGFR